MKKTFFIFLFSILFLSPLFCQNMLLFGTEHNIYNSPGFWTAGTGFNMKLINDYFQNDLMFNGGQIRAKKEFVREIVNAEGEKQIIRSDTDEYTDKFLFTVKDNFYLAYDWKWIGLRAGVFASIGIYDVPDFPHLWDFFFNTGGFGGVCFFPKSLFALAVDAGPGYSVAFRLGDGPQTRESGFSLVISLSLRINFDRF